MATMQGRVLIIAGSDSGGGAGIQADIKTVTALGGFAMTAVTALTAQNTRGVSGIHDVPPAFVVAQIAAVLADIGADCIKVGMLHRPDMIDAVADALAALAPAIPIVVDPVMIAKGGATLLEDAAVATLRRRMVPMARLLTPNLPEAETLAGQGLADAGGADALASMLTGLGPQAVLLKGGHGAGPAVIDRLYEGGREIAVWQSPRIDTTNTHGTGCTLASGIAAGIAQGLSLIGAATRARAYVIRAIETAPGYGQGHGPLNHAHTMREFDGG